MTFLIGIRNGLVVIMPWSFPNAMKDPVSVIAPTIVAKATEANMKISVLVSLE